MVWLVMLMAFIYGSVFSSFVTLVSDRVPRGVSIVDPPSHCSSCGHRLGVIDLLPVIGSVLRRFRCAYCGVGYGKFHFLWELGIGIYFSLVSYLFFGMWAWVIGLMVVGLVVNLNVVSYLNSRLWFVKTTIVLLLMAGVVVITFS